MSVKLLTEHHLELLILKGGCTGSSESTLIEMPHCWKSHVMAQLHVSSLLRMEEPFLSNHAVAACVLCLFLMAPWVGLKSLHFLVILTYFKIPL